MHTIRVPASTSNLGAGFDCLGLALDLWLEVRLLAGPGPPTYHGTLTGLDERRDLLLRTFRDAAGEAASGWTLEARSEIPLGKGLGSSAAALVAGAGVAQLARGEALDPQRVFEAASAAEGHPDNAAPAAFGGLILAAGLPERLSLHPSLGIALAVPELGVDTHAARRLLPAQVARGVAVDQAARAAALVLGLTEGDPGLIRHGMDDQLAVPHRKHLIAGFDEARQAGEAAGAFAVTISGAGSSLLAVSGRELTRRVAQAMAEALARNGNPATPMTPAVSERGVMAVGG